MTRRFWSTTTGDFLVSGVRPFRSVTALKLSMALNGPLQRVLCVVGAVGVILFLRIHVTCTYKCLYSYTKAWHILRESNLQSYFCFVGY